MPCFTSQSSRKVNAINSTRKQTVASMALPSSSLSNLKKKGKEIDGKKGIEKQRSQKMREVKPNTKSTAPLSRTCVCSTFRERRLIFFLQLLTVRTFNRVSPTWLKKWPFCHVVFFMLSGFCSSAIVNLALGFWNGFHPCSGFVFSINWDQLGPVVFFFV